MHVGCMMEQAHITHRQIFIWVGLQEVFLSLENIPLNYSISMDEENEIMIRRLTLFFVPIAFAVILVIGLIGNILVIIVVS